MTAQRVGILALLGGLTVSYVVFSDQVRGSDREYREIQRRSSTVAARLAVVGPLDTLVTDLREMTDVALSLSSARGNWDVPGAALAPFTGARWGEEDWRRLADGVNQIADSTRSLVLAALAREWETTLAEASVQSDLVEVGTVFERHGERLAQAARELVSFDRARGRSGTVTPIPEQLEQLGELIAVAEAIATLQVDVSSHFDRAEILLDAGRQRWVELGNSASSTKLRFVDSLFGQALAELEEALGLLDSPVGLDGPHERGITSLSSESRSRAARFAALMDTDRVRLRVELAEAEGEESTALGLALRRLRSLGETLTDQPSGGVLDTSQPLRVLLDLSPFPALDDALTWSERVLRLVASTAATLRGVRDLLGLQQEEG